MTKLAIQITREYVPMTKVQEQGMRMWFGEITQKVIQKLKAEGRWIESKVLPVDSIPIDLDAPEFTI